MKFVPLDTDLNALAEKIYGLKKLTTREHLAAVRQACMCLRALPFPPGYISSIESEMFYELNRGGKYRRHKYVYLIFCGMSDCAEMLKVGVTTNVNARLKSHKTSNPVPNLWTYACCYPYCGPAYAIEKAILDHLSVNSIHGEWVSVPKLNHGQVEDMVEELALVADKHWIHKTKFSLMLDIP